MGLGLKWFFWLLTVTAVGTGVVVRCVSSETNNNTDNLVSRIAFGSCANQSAPQPIWDAIIKFDPQVFIWLGDNIYGDIRLPNKLFGRKRNIGPWKNTERFVPASEQEMESKYEIARSNPGYSRLREKTKVIGTWDDHDYGLNDAGKEFSRKVTNQRLMLDFLEEPHDSPRRKQAGVYTSYTFGPTGRQIKVILLDTRYHRDPLRSDGSILGSSQWTWLEKELHSSPTAVTIIGSSIQVISNLSATTGPLFYMESWGRFPKERDRLFKLLADSKRGGVFFISGDVHFGEITRYDCATGYPLYDVTASGITQAVDEVVPRPLRFLVRLLAWLTPATLRVMDGNCTRKSCTYGMPNFGAIEIDWDANPVKLVIQVRDVDGNPAVGINAPLPELQAKKFNYVAANERRKHQKHCYLEIDQPGTVRYRLAILVYFSLSGLILLPMLLGVIWLGTVCCCRRPLKKKRD